MGLWKYGNKSVTQIPEGAFGFVYQITFPDTGMSYIGRKNFYSLRKRNFGKKELALITDKRKKKYEIVKKESDWLTYNSSNKDVLAAIERGESYIKEIIAFANFKKELTYLEEYYLYCNGVIGKKSFYNDNIAGRFFTKDVEQWVQIRK